MVLDNETSRNQYKFIKNINNKPKVIGVCAKKLKHLTSTQRPWYQRERKSPHTKNQLNGKHGANTEYQDDISVQNWNTIGVTKCL